ncbi:hypothetical protein [Streptomyces rhizosphaerihabitans]|uniref:hypothetical protein n=1 Tax=Streptomyces rhizosphaerihabitans TaxID=1266770 RepID=UPI0021BF111A|nr:hypothetical protein [Streptomyces rhizosphaerihabitans]MCT9003571.1 hypothetical protein [Streptomyces rhizosphaerihabitans]
MAHVDQGKVATATLVCGAVVASAILLWPASNKAPAEPTSEQIKASAQARLDSSLKAGRDERANILAVGKTPDEVQCQAAWENLLDVEQHELRRTMWMIGCVNASH